MEQNVRVVIIYILQQVNLLYMVNFLYSKLFNPNWKIITEKTSQEAKESMTESSCESATRSHYIVPSLYRKIYKRVKRKKMECRFRNYLVTLHCSVIINDVRNIILLV